MRSGWTVLYYLALDRHQWSILTKDDLSLLHAIRTAVERNNITPTEIEDRIRVMKPKGRHLSSLEA